MRRSKRIVVTALTAAGIASGLGALALGSAGMGLMANGVPSATETSPAPSGADDAPAQLTARLAELQLTKRQLLAAQNAAAFGLRQAKAAAADAAVRAEQEVAQRQSNAGSVAVPLVRRLTPTRQQELPPKVHTYTGASGAHAAVQGSERHEGGDDD